MSDREKNIETSSLSQGDSLEPKGVSAIHTIYFIGIGGIGMSGLARYFNTQGAIVSGYDKTPTSLTRQLQDEGIDIHFEENIDLIPKEADLVVYTPAIPSDHLELNYYKDNHYKVIKRSDVLQIITENSFNICVAGTHGKTTVSTMIAHLLRFTGYGCNAFLGGISANYNTNFWSNEKNVCVVEADEYDRSFLKLSPDVAVITAIDPDHLDIYGTEEEFKKAFVQFSQKLKPSGLLITKQGLWDNQTNRSGESVSYHLSGESASVRAKDIKVDDGSYIFDVVGDGFHLSEVRLNMGGLHNIENMIAAITVAKYLKIADNSIKQAVEAFKGVRRRFEYVLKNENHILIDDYAHHPEELKALISGVRSLYQQPLTLVFQPHLFSRTKDQADGFASVLSEADEVILLPIYPAREKAIEGVNSEMIARKMTKTSVQVLEKDELIKWVGDKQPELLVMAGAGDIDVLLKPVKEALESQ